MEPIIFAGLLGGLGGLTRGIVGLLKALGFSISDILEIRITESLLLGLLGATIGIFVGILYDVFLGAPIITEFLIGWASEYPSITPPIYVGIGTLLFLYVIKLANSP